MSGTRDSARPEGAAVATGTSTLAQRTRDVEIAVRRVRWFAIPFTVVQFALFTPSDDGPLPFPRWPVAAIYVVVLLATNLLSIWATRSATPERLRLIGLIELVIDTTLVNGVVVLFGFDADTRMWPLLSFPIVEGAMRAELRGALLTWGYGSAVYIVDQLLRLPGRENPAAWVGSIPWGSGILLFIALGTGVLAARVREGTITQERHAERLHKLLERSRNISSPRRLRDVHLEVAEAARELTGLRRVALYEHTPDGRWHRRAQQGTRGVTDAEPEQVPAFDQLVADLDGPEEVELSGAFGERTAALVPDATRVWAAPLRHEDRLLGLLLVAATSGDDPEPATFEPLLGLLAAQAAVALENARLAEAEERTIRELRDLDRLKDDFFSILAHELRSPMASISGSAELLIERFDALGSTRRQELLEMIRGGSQRLNSLIEDVYDSMRAERQELPITIQPVDLHRVIRGVAQEEVGRSSAHQLELELDEDAPPALVDPNRVHQVLQNLISNAVKYSPSGGTVTVGLRRAGDVVLISVEDEGLGITEEDQGRLFGRFERLHADQGIKGTGLGLYLVRTITEAMGGTVDVESRVGEGSTFYVRLPVAETISGPSTSTLSGSR